MVNNIDIEFGDTSLSMTEMMEVDMGEYADNAVVKVQTPTGRYRTVFDDFDTRTFNYENKDMGAACTGVSFQFAFKITEVLQMKTDLPIEKSYLEGKKLFVEIVKFEGETAKETFGKLLGFFKACNFNVTSTKFNDIIDQAKGQEVILDYTLNREGRGSVRQDTIMPLNAKKKA
jgi:hypothetical protein